MRIAARMAAKKNIPIVLDLVGVGVSRFRMDFVMSLLDEVHVDVIKGNLSEVKAVMEHGRCDGGVEVTDTADESDAKALACRAALRYGCICVITGETDYVAELCDEADCYDNNESSLMSTDAMSTDATGTGVMDNCVVNAVALDADGYTHNYRVGSITGGHPMMKRVTGTGCMLSGLICAFVAADCDDKYGAVMAALSCMKSAGGLAASDMAEHGRETNSCYFIKPGNAAYRDRLIDAVYHICDGDYEQM
ncbi:MAG: hydroxyethylthiazole kinase [Agathobacter rectalis]